MFDVRMKINIISSKFIAKFMSTSNQTVLTQISLHKFHFYNALSILSITEQYAWDMLINL